MEQAGATMTDFLASIYPWAKSVHVMAVLAWMAGLFYLPRLFVYHIERVEQGSETDRLFQTMERKLLVVIMTPAMIFAWFFGLCLVLTPGIVDWESGWAWAKAASVLAMTWFHFWCGARRREFVAGSTRLTGRQFRLMNELPTLVMIVIVVSVIVRPF